MKKILSTISIFALSAIPLLTRAETVYLINPLGATDPRELIGRLIAGVLSVIGSLTVLMFVYAGVLWITAQGDHKKVQRGKDIMIWATLGLGVIAGAYVFVQAIVNAFTTGSVT
jgi:fumarate reductase subunit D